MNNISGFLIVLCSVIAGCTPNLGQNSPYGNYGGTQSAPGKEKKFSIAETFLDVRWFPAHVRYSPDDTNLLVSLCHAAPGHANLCRIGRYHIASGKWEILPYEDKRTYRWPTYTPDGKWIVFSTGPCDEQYRCSVDDYVLARMPAYGSGVEMIADTIAREPSFGPDGKKLVYWRLGPAYEVRGRGALVSKLYEMDWETRKERELLSLTSAIKYDVGRPFLIDGGKVVVFYGDVELANEPMRRGLIRVEIGGRPLQTASDLYGLEVVSPERFSRVFDVARDGMVLYLSRRSSAEENTGNWVTLFLGSLRPNSAKDIKAFEIQYCFTAALSSDAQRIAFINGSPTSYHPTHKGLGTISRGQLWFEATYIDWPKLELKPGLN
jgi:Tol biopolymer transport system component